MKLYEILTMNKELLERMHGFGIRISDYYWVELYKEYQAMLREGYKKMYIVALLSEHYNICERKVYKVINMMEKDCQIGAI